MTQLAHAFCFYLVDPSRQLSIGHRAGSRHGSDGCVGGTSGGVGASGTPPIDQRVVDSLHVTVGT